MAYRPWGLLDWALNITNRRQWTLLGALGTEERSLAAWKWLVGLGECGDCRLLEIQDLPSRYTVLVNELIQVRENEFLAASGNANQIVRSVDLLTELHRIIAIAEGIEILNGKSIVLDITSLPKRFFFPILRHLYRSDSVQDLLVTYTCPNHYIEGEPLSEYATDWSKLPGFQGDQGNQETLVASVGFLVESMQNHIGEINKHESVKLLIPFPAQVSAFRRSWESIFRLTSARDKSKFTHFRVPTVDLSGAFDRIASIAGDCNSKLAFAPFGPKPISAAMCLFATIGNCAVHYPQPRVYNPKYSEGIGEVEGKSAVFAYWIKHDGEKLYTV
jgi:hypothetical protein